MKVGETTAVYSIRVQTVVNQMKLIGEKLDDERVREKILWSLTPKFEYVVTAIEKSKDLSAISIEELMGSLRAYEH